MTRIPAAVSVPWQAFPDTFAERASRGQWIAYPWLRYLSERITPKLVNGGGRFVITAAPQHGKSEFISNWVPTWYLNRFPTHKIILATYALEYAEKWGTKVRENLTENTLARIPVRDDTHTKKKFITSAGGQMICAGIGGPITGEGCHVLIIDDPCKNYQDAMSETIRSRNVDWYKSVARTRLQPGATAIVLQTRWHEEDLAGVLATEGGFEVINIPALCEDPTTDPLGRQLGQAMCPERYDEAALADIRKDVGEMIFSALYQQNPMQQGGNIIQGSWIKFYDQAPVMDEYAIFADLAYKDGEENDFTVIECWGRKGAHIYLIDQIRGRMGFPKQLDALLRMVQAHPIAYHREIEEKANGAALIQVARDSIPGLIANNPKTSKEARIAAVSPLYQSGNVWYPNPESHPWVKVNLDEITKFPRAKNDDTVDVASMGVKHLGRVSSSICKLQALSKW